MLDVNQRHSYKYVHIYKEYANGLFVTEGHEV